MTTDLYPANQAWIAQMKADGNTVIDLGANGQGFSAFYDMEKKAIF